MNGPHVRGFNASSGILSPIPNINFYAYGTLRYGVNVAGKGGAPQPILHTGAGLGTIFGPHVRGWDYSTGSIQPIAAQNFFAYNVLRFGVNLDVADFEPDEDVDIVTGPGPGLVFTAHVRGFDTNWGRLRPIANINVMLTDGSGTTGHYGARAAFVDTYPAQQAFDVVGSIGPDTSISYPNAKLMLLSQTPTQSYDVNQGWNCRNCGLFFGSNQR